MASRVADILKAAAQQQAEGIRTRGSDWAQGVQQAGQIGSKYAQLANTPGQSSPDLPPHLGGPQETAGTPQPGLTAPVASSENPALTDAFQLLGSHQGKMADLLNDPANYAHLSTALQAIKQDPQSLQALTQIGIGSEQIQQFEQQLTQRMAKRGGQGATSWLSGAL